jgi:hypothetical protein
MSNSVQMKLSFKNTIALEWRSIWIEKDLIK